MTRISLVRHGETDWNRARRIQGRTDVPLNDTGREQARCTGTALAHESWDAIYTSPLSRARETAAIIAALVGLPEPATLDAAIERDYGEAEGLNAAELSARFPGVDQAPGREARSEVAARVEPALLALAEEHPGGRLLVVTHGGLIRSILAHLEPDEGDHLTEPITNGSIHTLEVQRSGLVLIGFNEDLTDAREAITEQNAVEARESKGSVAP